MSRPLIFQLLVILAVAVWPTITLGEITPGDGKESIELAEIMRDLNLAEDFLKGNKMPWWTEKQFTLPSSFHAAEQALIRAGKAKGAESLIPRLERAYIKLACLSLSEEMERGLEIAEMDKRDEKNLLRLKAITRHLSSLAFGSGRMQTDRIAFYFSEAAKKHADLGPQINKTLAEIREKVFVFDETAEESTGMFPVEVRAKLRNIPALPDKNDLERRIDRLEEALKGGDIRFAWRLLEDLERRLKERQSQIELRKLTDAEVRALLDRIEKRVPEMKKSRLALDIEAIIKIADKAPEAAAKEAEAVLKRDGDVATANQRAVLEKLARNTGQKAVGTFWPF